MRIAHALVVLASCQLASAGPLPKPLETVFPAPGATGVARNSALVFRLSRSLSFTDIQVALKPTGSSTPVIISQDSIWGDQSVVDAVYRPVSSLAPVTSYTVTVAVTGMSYQYSFTTGADLDTKGPRLVSITPDPGGAPADPWGPFTFRFDEPLLSGFVQPAITDGAGNPLGDQIVHVRLSEDRCALEVRPILKYRIPVLVQIQIDPSRVMDLARNPVAGSPIFARWSTTLARDASAPRLIGQFPDPGEAGVPTDAVPQLLFDRAVSEQSVRQGGIVLEARGAVLPFQPRIVGQVVVLGGVSLLPETGYTVRVTDKLTDINGLAADQPASFQFTTGTGPAPDQNQSGQLGPAYDGPRAPINARIVFRSVRRLPSFAPLLFRTLTPAQSGIQGFLRMPASAELLDDRRTLVITPGEVLPPLSTIGIDISGLTDMKGSLIGSSITFSTSGERDDDAPRLLATAPEDGAAAVPVSSGFRVLLNEPVGLMTPINALRLVRNGEPWPGEVVLAGSALEFRPARALDPDSDYTLEMNGIADLAGNTMPPQRIAFHTAADTAVPPDFPKVVRSNIGDEDLGALDALEFESNLTMSSANLSAAVTTTVAQSGSVMQTVYDHPVRIETAEKVLRVVPVLPWPAGRNLRLSLTGQDAWRGSFSYGATFRARSNGDDTRPEVVSVTPAPGTAVIDGQTIRLVFSKPMYNASETNGGLVIRQGNSNAALTTFWSSDRLSVTVLLRSGRSSDELYDDPLVLVASSGLVDLAGNPLKPMVAQFSLASRQAASTGLPQIVASWPARDSTLDPRSPITIAFSGPVDAATLNRSVWVLTTEGRAAGSWLVSAGGTLATFRQQGLWAAGTSVWLMQLDPVINLAYGLGFSTKPPQQSDLRIVRTTLRNGLPANAVIEVEFNQDLPSGPGPLVLESGPNFGPYEAVACDESQPRPGVRRFTPRVPLVVGKNVRLMPRPGGGLTGNPEYATVSAPLSSAARVSRYRAPLPGAEAVPLNARVSLVFSGSLNELSVTESTVQLLAGGKPVLRQVSVSGEPGGSLAITPLEPLPPDQTIAVQINGLEDRLGRLLDPMAWAFRTGGAIDLTAPRLIYSNAPATSLLPAFDPQTPLRLEFDEPLDPAALDRWRPNNFGSPVWELSPDLRAVTVIPQGGWNRGESYWLDVPVADWSGNAPGTSSTRFTAGFETDREPLVLRAVSIRDGLSGLPLNAVFSLLFNKPVPSDALRAIRLMRGNERLKLSNGVSWENGRYTFAPATVLDPNTEYQLIVEGVQDSSGKVQTQAQTIRFSTGEQFDAVPPDVQFRFISRTAPLRVRFTEQIDLTAVLATPNRLTWIDSTAGYARAVPMEVSWAEDRLELTLTPKQELRAGTEYTLGLGGIPDLSGNTPASPPSFRFQATENPDTSPARVSIYPADGSSNVPTNAILQVVFSRVVDTPPVRLYEDDRLVLTMASQAAVTLRLQRALRPNLRYRIEVGAFRDDFDNDVPLASSSFSTAGADDRTLLRLVSSTPANGEAGVAPETPWQMTFNKPLQPQVYFDFPPTVTRAMPFRYSIETSGERLTLRPAPGWPAASSVQLTINSVTRFGMPSVSDWAGNRLASNLALSFRTAAVNDPVPPVLESVSPPVGSTIPTNNAVVELRFSKPVITSSGAIQLFYGSERANVSGVYGPDFRTVQFRLSPPANTRVTLVGTDAVRDNADNPITPFSIEYSTGPAAPSGLPKAELIEPKSYPPPAPNTTITVRFDRVMDAPSVIAAFRVTANGQNVHGSIDVQEAGRTYRFRPDMPFAAGASVKVYILPTAMDTDGLTMLPNSFGPLASFVVAEIAKAMSVAARGFGPAAPADAVLEVEFDRDLDLASVNGESVWLRRGSRLVPGRASLRADRVVQFTPSAPLEPGAEYILTAGAALTAADGTGFAGQDLRFIATDPEGAPEVESVETAEWNGLAAMRVRFTHPLSPLAVRAFHAETAGRRIEADVLPSTNGQEVWIVPRNAADGAFTVMMEGAPARNGHILSTRRLAGGEK